MWNLLKSFCSWRFNRIHHCRLCQSAHPNILHCSFEPTWVSPLNGISIGSAVFGQSIPGRSAWTVQSLFATRGHQLMWFFGRTRVCLSNSISRSVHWGQEGHCVTMPNFVNIGRTVADIWRFNGFQRWRPSASFIFNNSKFLQSIADRLERVKTHHRIKFHGDPSNRCRVPYVSTIYPHVGLYSILFVTVYRFFRADDTQLFFSFHPPNSRYESWVVIRTSYVSETSLHSMHSFILRQCGKCKAPFTRYNRLSNRLYNRFDNRLYRVNGV